MSGVNGGQFITPPLRCTRYVMILSIHFATHSIACFVVAPVSFKTMSAASGPGASYWTPENIDIATQGALLFFQVYYEAYDEPTRRVDSIPKMYDPTAHIIWNGNPIKGSPALGAFLAAMPLSRHDVQSMDCHPVDDVPKNANNLPTILVTVSGSVVHGPSVLPPPANGDVQQSFPNQVRKFHEVFVLKPFGDDQGLGGVQPRYHIQSANFRFVG